MTLLLSNDDKLEQVINDFYDYTLSRPLDDKLAIILDIDGTAIMRRNGVANPVVKKIYDFALLRGMNVFFLTARPEAGRIATKAQLKNAGYSHYVALFMLDRGKFINTRKVDNTCLGNFKLQVRDRINKAGYNIILNVGDNFSDVANGRYKNSFLLR